MDDELLQSKAFILQELFIWPDNILDMQKPWIGIFPFRIKGAGTPSGLNTNLNTGRLFRLLWFSEWHLKQNWRLSGQHTRESTRSLASCLRCSFGIHRTMYRLLLLHLFVFLAVILNCNPTPNVLASLTLEIDFDRAAKIMAYGKWTKQIQK